MRRGPQTIFIDVARERRLGPPAREQLMKWLHDHDAKAVFEVTVDEGAERVELGEFVLNEAGKIVVDHEGRLQAKVQPLRRTNTVRMKRRLPKSVRRALV